ncbi:MAG: MMPL family transporter [Deltaproteobacteria bacterium]|nr:MMPL family transporter [Deltaproteobacteria bacterium]MBW2419575.1 MMPL family transporter [Deltaproteobacteria bacterium]
MPILLRMSVSAAARPLSWLVSIGLATLAVAALVPRLELRTDGAALNPSGSASVRFTEADREAFHEREQVLILLSAAPGGPGVESSEGLRALRSLHDALDSIPGLEGATVQSLATLRDLVSDPELLTVGELLSVVPDDPAGFEALVRRIRRHPMADGLMLAPDGSSAALYVHFDEEVERRLGLSEIQRWIETHPVAGFELRLTGPVVAEALLGDVVLRDLSWQVPVMVGVIALLLFASLGTVGGVIVPLVEALAVLCWTFGAMALCGQPVTLVTTILPVILMAISITDEIHLLERVQEELGAATEGGAAVDRAQLRAALQRGLAAVGFPIVMTSLTTSIGFLSFLTASIVPLRSFGVFTALGILLAMLFTFSLIPALVMLLPPRCFLRSRPSSSGLGRFERFVAGRPSLAFGLGVLAVAIALPGIACLRIQDSWIDNFDPSSDLVQAERSFNRDFWGSYRFDVVAQGPPLYFAGPAGAALFEAIARMVADLPQVGGVLHYVVPLEQVAQSLEVEGPVSRLSRRQIADLTTLLDFTSGSGGGPELVNDDESMARALIYVKSANYRKGEELAALLETGLAEMHVAEEVEIHFSGDVPVALAAVRAIVVNQLRSIALTLVGVAALLFLFSRSASTVGLAMLPVASALALLFGGMGYAGLSLGIATSMFASLTVGIGVDFALHFQHAYQSARRRGEECRDALLTTLGGTGRAIRWNVGVLAAGFAVLVVSDLGPNRALGILLASAMLACYAMTLLLLPLLLPRVRSAAVSAPRVGAQGLEE